MVGVTVVDVVVLVVVGAAVVFVVLVVVESVVVLVVLVVVVGATLVDVVLVETGAGGQRRCLWPHVPASERIGVAGEYPAAEAVVSAAGAALEPSIKAITAPRMTPPVAVKRSPLVHRGLFPLRRPFSRP